MNDDELRSLLQSRLDAVEQRIRVACERSGRLRNEVRLIAVTKTVSANVAKLLPEFGVFDLGESRPQALWAKFDEMKIDGLHWHFVGHLQRNKLEKTLPMVSWIHSLDSVRVAEAINAEAKEPINVLIEVNASREPKKGGFAPEDVPAIFETISKLPKLHIAGLMTMAAYDDDPERSRPTFAEVRALRDRLGLEHLSMGMSNDYEVAIEEGATFIRLGTTLFEGLE